MALILLAAIPSVAQLPTATILGVAKDSSGAVVPNATVTIRNVDTNFTRTVMTGDDGAYRVSELPVGHYEVKSERTGFKTETRTGITLEVTQQAVVNFSLEVGSTVQQVVVTGEAPIVNTQDATLGGTVNEQRMADLPLNGRNYVDLTLLQPGVNPDRNNGFWAEGTTFSVNGAPVRSNNFTLDGAILQTLSGRHPSSVTGTTLGVDGIKEFRVITSSYQAEYGLAMGSQMVAVSKNGTNQFHGDAFEYFRNSALDAKDFFHHGKIAPFQHNQFGGSFGGPIKKDKTFFFATYEEVRLKKGTTNNLAVPAAGCHGNAGDTITVANCPDIGPLPSVVISPNTAPFLAIIPNPNVAAVGNGLNLYEFSDHTGAREHYGQMRVDQTFSAADAFFVRYTVDNAALDSASSNYAYFRDLQKGRNQWISLSENHIFSPSVLNTARFSFSRTHSTNRANDIGLTANNGLGPAIRTGFPTGVVVMGGVASGSYDEFGSPNDYPQTFNLQNIYTLSDDVNWTWGKHSFKFGVLLNRFNDVIQSTNSANGQIQFLNFAHFAQSRPNLVEFEPPFSDENRFYIFNTAGFYGQDDWRVSQRLTVNMGLRYEFMNTPREKEGRQSRMLNDYASPFTVGPIIKNNTLRDVSPRIGLAYDLFGNGKTALRSGFGIYYDIGNIGSVLGNNAIGAPPFSGLVDIAPSSNPSVQSSFDPVNGFPFPIPNSILNFYQPTTPGGITPQFMDYNYLSPYMIQYNVSIQQQLPWNMGLGVAYVGNHGVHLATIRESNPIFPTSTGPCGDPASLCVDGKVQFWDNSCAPPAGSNPACGSVVNYAPVNPNISSTINIGTFSTSRYNALQIVLNKRTTHGLEFQGAYTRSRVTDDTQGQSNVRDCTVAGGLQGVDPLHPKQTDTGPSCFNIPNNFEFSMLYHLPNVMTGKGFLPKAANGWWISSVVSIESGEPFSVFTGNQRSNSGVLQGQQDRVNINTPALLAAYPCTSTPGNPATGPDTNPCAYTPIPYDPNTVIIGKVNQWFNPAMFSISPHFASTLGGDIGQLGTSGRNILSGPHVRSWDFSLVKDTKVGFLGEGGMVQFRAEFFNVLNHPNFGEPGAGAFSGDSGDLTPFSEKPSRGGAQIKRQNGDPRQIQFALRVQF